MSVAGKIRTIVAVCIAVSGTLLGESPARAGNLGPAEGYNVFILKNDTEKNTDAQGQVAVGGNATFSSYGVASSLSNASNALVTGGNLSYSNGTINGSTFVGQNGTLSSAAVNGNLVVTQKNAFTNGSVHGDLHYGTVNQVSGLSVSGHTIKDSTPPTSPVNFSTAATTLTNLSNSLSHLTANGTESNGTLGLTLTGTNKTLDVFNLTAAQFGTANGHGLNIVVPVGATTIINISGSPSLITNFQMYNNGSSSESNPQINKTLFNFSQAGALSATGVSFYGSILAPNADLKFGNGHIDGTLIGKSLDGYTQYGYTAYYEAHNYAFNGNLPSAATPEPASITLAAIGSLVGGLVYLRRRRVARSLAR